MDKKITPKALAFAQDIVDNRNESTNVIIDYMKTWNKTIAAIQLKIDNEDAILFYHDKEDEKGFRLGKVNEKGNALIALHLIDEADARAIIRVLLGGLLPTDTETTTVELAAKACGIESDDLVELNSLTTQSGNEQSKGEPSSTNALEDLLQQIK